MIRIEDILNPENMALAMAHLLTKKDSCGIDNIHVSEFEEYWQINGFSISEQIRQGTYEPSIVLEREIINYNGKRRKIALMTCTDRFLLRALHQVLAPICENIFYPFSHAYRNNYGIETAVRMSADYINQGNIWIAEIDIQHFFDTLPLNQLEKNIASFLNLDSEVSLLIKKYLYCRVQHDGYIETKQVGILQGSPLSSIFSNLYLTNLDYHMKNLSYNVVRFSDDINIYTKTDTKALEALNKVTELLSILGLQVNKNKCGVFQALKRNFLGYHFEKSNSGTILAVKNHKEHITYHNWHTSVLQRIDHNYHIINNGILTKHDFTILFENENGKKYLPVETTDSLNVYSEVIFGTHFFDFLSKRKLRLAIFDKYGNNLGSFYSFQCGAAGKTLLKQAELYLNETKRLQIAKKLEIAAFHNIRSNLRYYKKSKSSEKLENSIHFFSETITKMNEATSIEELLLLEARGRQNYYHMFNEIINNEDFHFEQRTKRPPKDPLNALISFGNVYLYNRIATEIQKTSLDIRIGILHSTNKRAETLNLDIAELFKPILVDRAIFTLTNKRMLHIKEDFETTKEG